jgi:hypothetical protein
MAVPCGSGRKVAAATVAGLAVALALAGSPAQAHVHRADHGVRGAGRAAAAPAVTIYQGKRVRAFPGDAWVYPSVVIRNTGSSRLGAARLVISADHRMRFTDEQLGISRRDGQEEHLRCRLEHADRVMVCDDFVLDLPPSRSRFVVVYPQMGVEDTAPAPSESTVTFDLGEPVFASGQARVSIVGP